MRIGLIGAGRIGGTLASLAVDRGIEAALSNSRGPRTLAGLVSRLGPLASAGTVAEVAATADLVVVSIPFLSYRQVPADDLAGKVVIDTNNYYPPRDGHFSQLDAGTTTSSELLAAHLPRSRVVKAFNSIYYRDLGSLGRAAGEPGRLALPIAGDSAGAKNAAARLIEQFGFDVIDAGPLAAGRRFQPGTPPYDARLDAPQLRAALAAG